MTALIVGSGAQWAVVQSVAWARMLVDYSRHASIVVAVKQTFDGEHPCALCKKVQVAKKEREQEKEIGAVPILKAVLTSTIRLPSPEPVTTDGRSPDRFASLLFPQPPVPPPRALLSS